MISHSMNLNTSSIDSQHTALYLLCGLYGHANNHFSLQMITSIMSDSVGVSQHFPWHYSEVCQTVCKP